MQAVDLGEMDQMSSDGSSADPDMPPLTDSSSGDFWVTHRHTFGHPRVVSATNSYTDAAMRVVAVSATDNHTDVTVALSLIHI